jgi:glutamate-ammonia-ligase adenylyltransferase
LWLNQFVPRSVWNEIVRQSADPVRVAAALPRLREVWPGLDRCPADQARVLAAVLSGSAFLTERLIAQPELIARCLDPARLQQPRALARLRREADQTVAPPLRANDPEAALQALRELHRREMLRIAARDLARLGTLTDITLELSNLADVCLEWVLNVCVRRLTARFGHPFHQNLDGDWHPTAFVVIGLGKLGSQELNYRSDIDLMFAYTEEGHVFREPPARGSQTGRGMSNHQFFQRLAEAMIAELTRLTPEGALYRVDLRLRPEGEAGPLVRSLASYENYYAQWGQTWERMMLMKARCVAGDAALGAEFIETVQPFRHPRSMSESLLREIAAMKQRTEQEMVRSGELAREVKRGPGGIRDIEFVAQALQLLHAGRQPFLQEPKTIPALEKLARYRLLPPDEARDLIAAYTFLREAEHRLQMEADEQTHTLPVERQARERLARLLGFAGLADFEPVHAAHRRRSREIYDRVLHTDATPPTPGLPGDFDTAAEQWRRLLTDHHFRDPEHSRRVLREFAIGPGYVHVSARTTELARELIVQLLALCPGSPFRGAGGTETLSDPDRVVTRLDAFLTAYGARAALYETWTHNPNLFRLLLLLFDRSEFLAEIAIRTPDLVDDLELSGRLKRSKTAPEILADLRHGSQDPDQSLWLRRYHQAELMRIALREILGLADFEQNLVELSALARACLSYALDVVLRRRSLTGLPLAVIGLGKLGGDELNYGSDLDLMFVAAPQETRLPELQPVAAEVMALLSERTPAGYVFDTDARLRPDGEKGLLVNTLTACEEYYQRRAQLWELQALTRASFVAGDAELGAQFEQLASRLTDFRRPRPELAAWSEDWREEIHRMRMRIEKERTPPGRGPLAFKTGAGGLMDAEFIAQTLCLAHGWREPNTLRALEHARQTAALPAAAAGELITNYRRLRRIEGILRRWSIEAEIELPDDPAAQQRVAVRCGFARAEDLLREVTAWRGAVRRVYDDFFGPAGASAPAKAAGSQP